VSCLRFVHDPANVILERIGRTRSIQVLAARMAERRPPPEQAAHVRGLRDRPVRFLIVDIEVALSGGQAGGVVRWRAWFAS
jgi:hypothetical protein